MILTANAVMQFSGALEPLGLRTLKPETIVWTLLFVVMFASLAGACAELIRWRYRRVAPSVAGTVKVELPGRYRARWQRSDREFLPAALEILETPPSPIKIAFLSTICLFATVALIWAYVSRVDIIAVAQGKIQPTGRVKVIQPLQTSRVRAIKVENGQEVKAGEVLVEFDPSEAAADQVATSLGYASFEAEALRRRAAIDAAQKRELAPTLSVAWPDFVPTEIRSREERVYTADILQLRAQVASLEAQRVQKEAEKQRLITMINAESDLLSTLQERVSMREKLLELNAGSKSNLLDATQLLQSQLTTQAQQKGQLAETEANLIVHDRDITKAHETFIAENAQKLAEAERQAAEFKERNNKANAILEHMTLRSPIDGVVQASSLTTVGQVVTSSQELMRIVPEGGVLEVECYLPNRDIGFVKTGDHAILKIESFPFTRYGTVDAEVVRLASDAIPEPEAEMTEQDETRQRQSLSRQGGQRVQNLVFPVTIRPRQSFIAVDGTRVPLTPGMAVTAEIRTGDRRVLEYFFSPLVKVGTEAIKER